MPLTHIDAKKIDVQAQIAKILLKNKTLLETFQDTSAPKTEWEKSLEAFNDSRLSFLKLEGTYDRLGDGRAFLSRADMTKDFHFEAISEFFDFFKYVIELEGYPLDLEIASKADSGSCTFKSLIRADSVFLCYGDILKTNALKLKIKENEKAKNFRVAFNFGESVLGEWHVASLNGALMQEVCTLFLDKLVGKILVHGDLRISKPLAEYFLVHEMDRDSNVWFRSKMDNGVLLLDLTPDNGVFKKYLSMKITQESFTDIPSMLEVSKISSFNVDMPLKTTICLLDGTTELFKLSGILGLKLVRDFYNGMLKLLDTKGYCQRLLAEQVKYLDRLAEVKNRCSEDERLLIERFSENVIKSQKPSQGDQQNIIEIYRRFKA